ncbi:MAG: hypothetical protein JXQ27_13905 [Acidobacteria bacterium]|nr:hypothetical protein [Acidobacteriota bacterium]
MKRIPGDGKRLWRVGVMDDADESIRPGADGGRASRRKVIFPAARRVIRYDASGWLIR